jgi:hypothetical protein
MLNSPSAFAERSIQVRRANKRIRDDLANGRLTIAQVMRDQPTELADRALFEILLLARGFGRKRLLELNSRALDEQINLALTLKAADPATRNWVAANALRHSGMSTWERLMV